MSLQEGVIGLLNAKLKAIKLHKADLHALIDSHINKQLEDATRAVNEKQDIPQLKKIKLRLDSTLDLLLMTAENFSDQQEETACNNEDNFELSSSFLHKNSYSLEIKKRLEALETFVNELKQDQMANNNQQFFHIQNLQTEVKSLEDKLSTDLNLAKQRSSDLEEKIAAQTKHSQWVSEELKIVQNKSEKEFVKKTDLSDLMSWKKTTDQAVVQLKAQTDFELDVVKRKHRDMELKMNQLDVSFKQVSILIVRKLSPLNHLQKLLNEKMQKLPRMHPANEKTVSGITAYLDSTCPAIPAPALNLFRDVLCNVNHNFDSALGVYRAPVNGLYLASVTLRQVGPGRAKAYIVHEDNVNDDSIPVCKVMTSGDAASSSSLGVAWLRAGDNIYVKIIHREEAPRLSPYSSFSCCLIQEC